MRPDGITHDHLSTERGSAAKSRKRGDFVEIFGPGHDDRNVAQGIEASTNRLTASYLPVHTLCIP